MICISGIFNIIDYCNRPFKSTEEMDSLLIENWRNTIKAEDTIFNLGDVTMGGGYNKEKIAALLSNLPGRKILIMGNHDRGHSIKWWCEAGFDMVSPYPIIYNEWHILSHEYVFLNEKMPYINIHGHTHDKNIDRACYINASVEQLNYKPICISELVVNHKYPVGG